VVVCFVDNGGSVDHHCRKHIVTVDKLISYLYTDIKCDLLYMCVCIDISDEVYSSGFLRQHSL
jgi:hypothetical protein